MMRRLGAVSVLLVLSSVAAGAADVPRTITGLFLTTNYPAMTVRAGETTTVDLTVHNFRLPPQSLEIGVPQTAAGWKATILGGGQPVAAVEVTPDSTQALQLRLEPPKEVAQGDYRFVVEAKNAQYDEKLPITIAVGKEVPAKLKLATDFPAQRGTAATAFKYKMTVTNDSGRDATVNFSADTPKNFEASFTEAYATQQITSIPIKAGQSKDIDASLTIPRETRAGVYKLVLHAKTEQANASLPVSLTIVGRPQLSVAGVGGRLSGEAYAGQGSPLSLVLRNDGSAPAHDIQLTATTPEGWKSSFAPDKVEQLAPGRQQLVKLTLTPSNQAIAGDYQATVNAAAAGGLDQSADFRITVLTSTLWGSVGIAVIVVSLVVVVFAVGRFGRR